MKKHYLLMAAFASAMAFTACTNDDEPVINGGENGSTSTIVSEGKTLEIAISNTGEGASTRNSRPLTSSAADNNVDRVQLVMWASTDGSSWAKQTMTKPDGFDDAEGDAAKEALFTTDNQVYLQFLSGTQGAEMDGTTNGLIKYTQNDTEGVPGDVDHINKKATLRV